MSKHHNNPAPHPDIPHICATHFLVQSDDERCSYCPALPGNDKAFHKHCLDVNALQQTQMLRHNEKQTEVLHRIEQQMESLPPLAESVKTYTKWLPRGVMAVAAMACFVISCVMKWNGKLDDDLYAKLSLSSLAPLVGPFLGDYVKGLFGKSGSKALIWPLAGTLTILALAALIAVSGNN